MIGAYSMLKKIDPTGTASWRKLAEHYDRVRNVHMRDLFAADPERFKKFSLRFNDMLVDYSKNRITRRPSDCFLNLPRRRASRMPSKRCLRETR